jgi:hypothetical protein
MTDHECDGTTPGGVYLCQTGEDMSCGACCGLYNVAAPDMENISTFLRRRTELFERTPRDYDSLVRFKEKVESMENQDRPYPEFHHCPYLGFVGDTLSRPGCLLHPLNKGNNSVDHRGLSHWGGLACATYFCPTCTALPVRFKKILRMVCGNWHVFGLAVTETEMIRVFFTLIEQRLNRELDPAVLSGNRKFIEAAGRFFSLKTAWPYRTEGFNRLGNYFFNDNLYPRTPIDYENLGSDPSEYDGIFRALGSWFSSWKELEEAENRIKDIILDAVSSALP